MGPNQLEKYIQQRLNFIEGHGCDVGGGLGYSMTITETTIVTHCEVSLRNDEDEAVRTTIVFDPPYRMRGRIEYRLVFHRGKYRLYEMGEDGTMLLEARRETPEERVERQRDEFFERLDADIAAQIEPPHPAAAQFDHLVRDLDEEGRRRLGVEIGEFLENLRNHGPLPNPDVYFDPYRR